MRFGNNLVVVVDTKEKYLDYSLPPLTIQTLVENAVKHNEVSKRKPLALTIKTTDSSTLVVMNSIQEKITNETGTGIGLTNLSRQFQLLIGKDISVSNENNEFRVEIPLINP